MTGHPFTFDDVSAPHLSTTGGDESIQRLSRYSITDMTSTGHILRSGPTDNNAQPAVQSTQTIKQSKINPVVTSTDQPGATTPFTTAANLVSTTTTSLTPIIITSIEQLDSIGVDPSMPLSGNYVLGNDIDASGFTFTPIGVASSGPFTGTLNGAGYSIDGLTDAGGLFFGIAGTIENLTLVDPTIIANAAAANGVRDPGVGALGYTLMDGASLYRIGVSGGSVSGTGFVGGLIGYNDGGIVTQSFSTASVTINDSGYAGGLVGDNDGAISACYSAGSVTGSPGATVGGLAGVNSFDYVTAGGSIAQSYSAGPISEGLVAGGLVGANQNPITNSVWDTQASGETSAVGITAYNGSLIGVAGLSSTQLQSGTLPAGFDPTVWGAAPGVYPYLLWSASLNRIPTATPSVVPVPTGYTLEVVAPGILADTSDPDGDVLTVSAVDGTAAYVGKPTLGAYGTLTLNANGSYIYQETQPLKVAVAQGGAFDAFTYTVSDGRGGTASSTLTFDISPATPVPLPTQTTPGVSLEIQPLEQVVVQSVGGPEDDLLADGSRSIYGPLLDPMLPIHQAGPTSPLIYREEETCLAIDYLMLGRHATGNNSLTLSDGFWNDNSGAILPNNLGLARVQGRAVSIDATNSLQSALITHGLNAGNYVLVKGAIGPAQHFILLDGIDQSGQEAIANDPWTGHQVELNLSTGKVDSILDNGTFIPIGNSAQLKKDLPTAPVYGSSTFTSTYLGIAEFHADAYFYVKPV